MKTPSLELNAAHPLFGRFFRRGVTERYTSVRVGAPREVTTIVDYSANTLKKGQTGFMAKANLYGYSTTAQTHVAYKHAPLLDKKTSNRIRQPVLG